MYKTRPVSVRLDPADLKVIDDLRGEQSRSKYIYRLLVFALTGRAA